jgi:hypothetical protein
MANFIKIAILVLFGFVQTVDIAVLDTDQEALDAIHADLGIDFNTSMVDHDIHSGCDMFHHLLNAAHPNSQSYRANKCSVLMVSAEPIKSQQQGPPVPPPLS